ncbi:RIM15 [Candida jiufengensis]|uniref:RIM15 n=1 Tax=Candida jiufengensis TaxID=497108 RepID=UPI002224FB7F|nr:RIM15 [Candida jiufengensis]KAI5949544.1 RIM15 [Candida jiufengensis]
MESNNEGINNHHTLFHESVFKDPSRHHFYEKERSISPQHQQSINQDNDHKSIEIQPSNLNQPVINTVPSTPDCKHDVNKDDLTQDTEHVERPKPYTIQKPNDSTSPSYNDQTSSYRSLEEQIDLRLASSNNPTIIMELDLDGNIRYLSQNWEYIVGTSVKKIVNHPISKLIIGSNDDDYQVFKKAIDSMIFDDASYKVKFITGTNRTRHENNGEEIRGDVEEILGNHADVDLQGQLTPHNSFENLQDINLPIDDYVPIQQSQVITNEPKDSDSLSRASSLSSKLSNDGDFIELEAQGILIHDTQTKVPNHSMWTIRPFVHIDLDLSIPLALIDLLGFGSEIFEGYLMNLKNLGISEEENVPQPKTILCRICENNIPAWFIEKHSDLCIIEHRADEHLQQCQDSIVEQRDLINKIIESLEFQAQLPLFQSNQQSSSNQLQSSLSSSSSPKSISPTTSSHSSMSSSSSDDEANPSSQLVHEYKGIPLPQVTSSESSSPRLANKVLSKNFHARNKSLMYSKKFPFGPMQKIKEICDEAILINPPSTTNNNNDNNLNYISFSPSSEKSLNFVINPTTIETSDLAIRQILEDTKVLVNDKLESLSRLTSILQYSAKIKKEVDLLVLETVRETVEKIRNQTAAKLSRSCTPSEFLGTPDELPPSLDLGNQQINQQDQQHQSRNKSKSSLDLDVPKMVAPKPSRSKSPMDLLADRSQDNVLTPKDFLIKDSKDYSGNSSNSSLMPSPRQNFSMMVNSQQQQQQLGPDPSRSSSKELLENFDNSRKSSGNNSNYSSPRRYLSPAPYNEKNNLTSLQRSNTIKSSPISSPLVDATQSVGSQHSDKRITKLSLDTTSQQQSFTADSPSQSQYTPGSQKSSITRPPLSPLLVSTQQPSSKPTTIKDYEVVKPISKGAFGSVFLAKRKLTGDYVAIKCLRKRDMIAKNQVLNVKSERAVMMRQSDSPYVAQLYSSFQSKDYLYLVMEYLNGGDCGNLIKALGTLGSEWSAKYIAEIIVGVNDLHSRGIIHRDLKPDNILIDKDGHLKLTDFGLSRLGVVGRQTNHRKSSTNEQSVELFRSIFGSGGSGSAGSIGGGDRGSNSGSISAGTGFANDDPYQRRRKNSLSSSVLLSPTLENSKLSQSQSTTTGLQPTNSPTLAFLESFGNVPSGRFKNGARSNSNNLESPLLKPIIPRTASESSFAIIDDESPQTPVTNYALYHPKITNELKTGSEGGVDSSYIADGAEIKKFVGTPDYLAPETIEGIGQSEASDWWSIGCILFEFLYGYPPFHADSPEKVFDNILSGVIQWPDLPPEEDLQFCSPEGKDLIMKLLTLNPEDRLGSNGTIEIMQHPFFQCINWDTIFDEPAPFVPNQDDPESTDYFELRGAAMAQFPREDSSSDEEKEKEKEQQNKTVERRESLNSLQLPPSTSASQALGKKERRSSKLSEPGEFGSFHFRNLSVLEKQNKDVINRLKSEHLEHRNSFSSSSSESTPKIRSRGFSFGNPNTSGSGGSGSSGLNVSIPNTGSSPFKRPISPPNINFGSPINSNMRSSSPHRSFDSPIMPVSKHERIPSTVSTYSSGDEFNQESPNASTNFYHQRSTSSSHMPISTKSSKGSNANATPTSTPTGLNPSIFQQYNLKEYCSANSSDSDDTTRSNALLRVQRRREGSRMSDPVLIKNELDVLYCEPVSVVRHQVVKLLEKSNCIVVSISDGEELIKRATSQVKFDFIMTGLRLSKVDAMDAVKLIKYTTGKNSTTPIIAITGLGDEAKKAGCFDYIIEKPVNLDQIKKCLSKFSNDEAVID